MSENQQIVLNFIKAVNERDINRALAFLDAECFYHNIAETKTGNVLTERTDRFLIKGKWVEVPVMGAFELRDGKITAWRDYFDVNQVINQWPESADSLR